MPSSNRHHYYHHNHDPSLAVSNKKDSKTKLHNVIILAFELPLLYLLSSVVSERLVFCFLCLFMKGFANRHWLTLIIFFLESILTAGWLAYCGVSKPGHLSFGTLDIWAG